MKKFRLITMVSMALFLSSTFIACSDDDDGTTPPAGNGGGNGSDQTIAQIASENDQTDSLVVALSQAGLVDLFNAPGSYTVFAPTNEAFRNFLASNSFSSISDIPTATLTAVLQYHVLGSVVRSTDLNDNSYATTINQTGPNGTATVIEIDVTGGVKLNNTANVTAADVNASNGVIHIIDEVISPRSLVELVLLDERFTSLVDALTAYNFGYVSVLEGNGPFTVFAPTNQAFADLLASNPAWNQVSDIDSTTLGAVLTYHVINGSNIQAGDLTQGAQVTTLQGNALTIDLSNGAQLSTTSMNQGNVNITATDIQGTNGVIHAVDQVLLPQ
tara:strand:- start:37078 stop:38067 length:990 start_codon:yes stop_codon:yes gene_type:complete